MKQKYITARGANIRNRQRLQANQQVNNTKKIKNRAHVLAPVQDIGMLRRFIAGLFRPLSRSKPVPFNLKSFVNKLPQKRGE